MGSAAIFSGSDVKTLKSNLDLNGNAKVLSGSVDPSQTATSAPLGSIYLSTLTGYLYKKSDAGSTTNWINISLGGSSGKNYIQFGSFENNATTGWSAVGVPTVTNGLPVSVGSGAAAFSAANGGQAKGANTTSPAVVSSGQLAGLYSLNLATSGAGTIGDGYISQAYTIDIEDQAKVMSFKLFYKSVTGAPVMGGTSANTYAVAIYDLVNNAWIIPAGCFNFVQSSGVGICQGNFQTSSNMTSFQIFIYSPVAPVGASSLYLDDIFVGPQSLSYGPPVSDWSTTLSLTPSGGFGTVASQTYYSRRIGDTLHFKGVVQAGTVAASTLSFAMPSGFSIDTSKLATGKTNQVGHYEVLLNAAGPTTHIVRPIFVDSASSSTIYLGYQMGSNLYNVVNGSTILSNSDSVAFEFSVPISGFSSTVQMSNDTDTRVVGAYYNGTPNLSATTVNTYDDVYYQTKQSDTHSAYNTSTGVYTIPVSGYYDISAMIDISNVHTYLGIGVYKNGATRLDSNFQYNLGGSNVEASITINLKTVPFVAGDTFKIQVYPRNSTTTIVANQSYFSVNRVSGPSVIAATEKVSLLAQAVPTGTLTNSFNVVKIGTVLKDTHGTYATGTGLWTAPRTGFATVTGSVDIECTDSTTSHYAILSIYKNGVEYYRGGVSYLPSANATVAPIVSAASIPVVAGDTLGLYISTSLSSPTYIGGTAVQSNFSINMSGG